MAYRMCQLFLHVKIKQLVKVAILPFHDHYSLLSIIDAIKLAV